MKALIGERQTGKTTRLVEELRRIEAEGRQAVIVTFNRAEAQRVREKYQLEARQVVSALEKKEGLRGGRLVLLVDNAELILQAALGGCMEIGMLTATGEVVQQEKGEQERRALLRQCVKGLVKQPLIDEPTMEERVEFVGHHFRIPGEAEPVQTPATLSEVVEAMFADPETPATLSEAIQVADTEPMELRHRALMNWLIYMVKATEQRLISLLPPLDKMGPMQNYSVEYKPPEWLLEHWQRLNNSPMQNDNVEQKPPEVRPDHIGRGTGFHVDLPEEATAQDVLDAARRQC